MNSVNSNFSLIDASKSFRSSTSQRSREKGVPAKKDDFGYNKSEQAFHSRLPLIKQAKDFDFGLQKLSDLSIGKARAKVATNESSYISFAQKRNRFAKLREISKSHEV